MKIPDGATNSTAYQLVSIVLDRFYMIQYWKHNLGKLHLTEPVLVFLRTVNTL